MPAAKLTRAQVEQVKATAIATGSLAEAATLHGITKEHARQLACRGKWPVAHRAQRIAEAAAAHAVTVTARAAKLPVTAVTASTADALTTRLMEHGNATKLGLAKAARKAAEHLAEQPAKALLKSSRAAKDWSQTASTVHGWHAESTGTPAVTVPIQINVG